MAGDASFEDSLDLSDRFAFGCSAGDVGLGGGVDARAGQHDGVQCPIELAIPASIEAVAGGQPGGRGDRSGSREHGEGDFGPKPARMRPADQHLSGTDWTDARQGEQLRCHGGDELVDFGLQLVGFSAQSHDALRGAPEHARGGAVLEIAGGSGAQGSAVGDLASLVMVRSCARRSSGAATISALRWWIARVRATTALARVLISTRSASRRPRLRG